MKPTILITGGAGYIGSHTAVELITSGYNPIIVDNFSNSFPFVLDQLKKITGKDIPCYNVNCNSPAFRKVFEENKIDGVIHFAANKAVGESVNHPLKYYRNNIGSLVNLLDLMQEYNVSNIVFSSSCTVYGEPNHLPVTENSPIQPANSPYGNTKQIGEEILRDTINSSAIKAIALRYFNPIGAHPSGEIGELPIGTPNNLVPFITQTAAGLRDKLTVFGDTYNTIDGSCIRDYIHVVDLAKAHIKALDFCVEIEKNNYFDIFNIGTGKGNTVLEIIRSFEEVTGIKLSMEIGPKRAGDVEKIYAEVTKSSTILKWSAEKTNKQALEDAWRWQLNLKQLEHLYS